MRLLRGLGPVASSCVLALLLGACTPTARTPGPYAAKARAAARAVHSAVASDVLLIEAVQRGHTVATYVSVATSEAEGAGSQASSTFLSIQPPDHASEQLRDDLSDLFSFAEDALGQARIAGRRGDTETLIGVAATLQQIDEQLSSAADGQPFDTEQLSASKSESDSEQSASDSSSSG